MKRDSIDLKAPPHPSSGEDADASRVDRLVENFIPYMRSVARCERQMGELNFTWSLIESTAKMTCPVEAKTILPAMASTRRGFGKLESQLVAQLVRENVRKIMVDMSARAQVVVDILVRNLFERTADVGFLATDEDICAFVKAIAAAGPAAPVEGVTAIRRRLEEYRNKYTVYDEILVLDRDGRVLAQLDDASPVEHSRDPLVAESLASHTFVETFRATDLRPDLERALVFSRRIDDPQSGVAIGVLCLCFRFADEMAGIFAGLADADDRSVMLLVDREGVVISSSDSDHVPVGKRLEMRPDDSPRPVAFAGREYLAQTRATRGYQGYFGQGWQGQVMVAVDGAFRHAASDALEGMAPEVLAGVLGQADALAPALVDIARQADRINLSLRRVVWNGEIMAAGKEGDLLKLKSILQQISETGTRTSSLFAHSIRDLYGTVVSASLADAQHIAKLAIDIMDRNLYERADDCRWWALAPALRSLLAKPALEPADVAKLERTLAAINGLYTVYTRIVVFDRNGRIVAGSALAPEADDAKGRSMSEATVKNVMMLRSGQQYWVTPFEPTDLYEDRPTYIYCAAIRAPGDSGNPVGGIGIVFDSEPQFIAMLCESLPDRHDVFALFVEPGGRIVASTDPEHAVGTTIEIDPRFLRLPNGESTSAIIEHRGQYFVVGAATSSGYREYKRSGDYENDVVALVFVPLCNARSRGARIDPTTVDLTASGAPAGTVTQLATVVIGEQLFGMDAAVILEAVEPTGIVPLREAPPYLAGLITYESSGATTYPVVQVINTRHVLGLPPADPDLTQQVVVVRTASGLVGLLVDHLVGVVELGENHLEPALATMERYAKYIRSIIKIGTPENLRLLLLLDPERLLAEARGD